MSTTTPTLTAKDLATDQDVRWCPGCGDYSILKQVQSTLAEAGVDKENTVFVSGIGCSSRFPYYMDTYGIHSIHGRATAIASGLKATRPELSVWIITGDGDSLSIGGNHLIHALRRNFDVNILLFNNEIYGLTKGQYSPTSPKGQVTKSTPMGSLDHPFNPLALAMGADATFIARSMDRDPKHMRDILQEADKHKGTSLIEIYQNCNVFNDGAFEVFTDKGTKAINTIFLEEGKPLIFGNEQEFAIRLNGFKPEVVNTKDWSAEDLWIHDPADMGKAMLLTRMFDDPKKENGLPRPFGVFYRQARYVYEEAMQSQIDRAVEVKGDGDLDKLIRGNHTWQVA
jgi:2-oxoglutarate ferredoxin oxidoreductase subunit beta